MEQIITERLVIRRFTADDWPDLHEYLSDEEVVRFEPYEPFTIEQAQREAGVRACSPAFWAVCLSSGKLIGNLYLAPGDFGTWELGYVFNRAFHGRGYATESATALIDHAFSALGARRIIAQCNPLNAPSWRLLERLSMRREGTLIQNVSFKTDANGRPIWSDTYEYAILKSEWIPQGKSRTVPAARISLSPRRRGG